MRSILALSIALAAPLISAFPITGTTVNCREGPGTSYDVVTTYNLDDDVQVTCQVKGESVNGDYFWDKTEDDCYVTDYYVRTGTTGRIVDDCNGGDDGSGGDEASSMNGPITRDEIISRGESWIDQHVPYSMEKTHPDLGGTEYRTDCSGFVAMALHASAPGASTVDLIDIGTKIAWKDLQPGDFVGTLGPGTGGANGHVTLFLSWANLAKTSYHSLECRGTAYGCVAFEREVGWTDGSFTAKPYKYIHVKE